MSYQFYLLTHLVGVFLMLLALGGAAMHMLNGGTRENFPARKWVGILHGIGVFIALVGGFGLLARLRIFSPMPPWVLAKIGIWVVFAVMPIFIYRLANAAKIILLVILLLAGLSASFAIYKPSLGANPMPVSAPDVPPAPPEENFEAQPGYEVEFQNEGQAEE